jgi:hypothetical protein
MSGQELELCGYDTMQALEEREMMDGQGLELDSNDGLHAPGKENVMSGQGEYRRGEMLPSLLQEK